MAIREVVLYPNDILRQRSRKVTSMSGAVQRLIDDMADTLADQAGVGLAAPQVGELLRIVTIRLPEDSDDPLAGELIVMINPEIIKSEADDWEPDEGCLSLPGYYARVRRYRRVTARAQDRHGKEYRLKARGLLAQAIQHEVDHLNGVMFIDHLASLDELRRIGDDDDTETDDEADGEETRGEEAVPAQAPADAGGDR